MYTLITMVIPWMVVGMLCAMHMLTLIIMTMSQVGVDTLCGRRMCTLMTMVMSPMAVGVSCGMRTCALIIILICRCRLGYGIGDGYVYAGFMVPVSLICVSMIRGANTCTPIIIKVLRTGGDMVARMPPRWLIFVDIAVVRSYMLRRT